MLLMFPASAEVSGHRLCPSLQCVYSVGWPASCQSPPWEPPEFQEKEALTALFLLYFLVISSHSGFSSCLPPSADIVILKYPQGIKIIWERRKELNF